MRLLARVDFKAGRDRLWLTGDLVNRGPEPLKTLRWVYQNRGSIEAVLGNHDLHMLSVWVAEQQLEAGVDYERGTYQRLFPGDTFGEILAAPDRDELLEWLVARPLVLADDEFILVHAALLPEWSVEDALGYSAEVQAALRADRPGFLRAMYGNEPNRWDEGLEGVDRLRVIVNAMCRLRVVDERGDLAFDFSGELADIPAGRRAWFWAEAPEWGTHTVVFGHWSALGLYAQEAPGRRVVGLDSGCVWGGELSAMRLEDRRIFQAPGRV